MPYGRVVVHCGQEPTWDIALQMAKLAKRGNRVKNMDDVDKTWTVLEKRVGSEELSPVDPYRRDLLCVDRKW